MSHLVQIQTEIRDPLAIRAACGRLALPEPVFGETQLFSSLAVGWAVQLPEWRYPVVCDVATAKIAFDNFGGRWVRSGSSTISSRRMPWKKPNGKPLAGHTAIEQALPDGSIRVQIAVGA